MPERPYVEYRGVRMVEGWPDRIRAAQLVREVAISGERFARVPYGNESSDWDAAAAPCHDCRVLRGEVHVPGCDTEECPRCHEQLITCECEVDFVE